MSGGSISKKNWILIYLKTNIGTIYGNPKSHNECLNMFLCKIFSNYNKLQGETEEDTI